VCDRSTVRSCANPRRRSRALKLGCRLPKARGRLKYESIHALCQPNLVPLDGCRGQFELSRLSSRPPRWSCGKRGGCDRSVPSNLAIPPQPRLVPRRPARLQQNGPIPPQAGVFYPPPKAAPGSRQAWACRGWVLLYRPPGCCDGAGSSGVTAVSCVGLGVVRGAFGTGRDVDCDPDPDGDSSPDTVPMAMIVVNSWG